KAFQKAVEIAKRNNATLILTHVVDTRTFATAEAYDKSLSERAENFAKELLNEYVEDAKEAGVTSIEHTIKYGYPKVAIAKEIAHDYDTDLVIIVALVLNVVLYFHICVV